MEVKQAVLNLLSDFGAKTAEFGNVVETNNEFVKDELDEFAARMALAVVNLYNHDQALAASAQNIMSKSQHFQNTLVKPSTDRSCASSFRTPGPGQGARAQAGRSQCGRLNKVCLDLHLPFLLMGSYFLDPQPVQRHPHQQPLHIPFARSAVRSSGSAAHVDFSDARSTAVSCIFMFS